MQKNVETEDYIAVKYTNKYKVVCFMESLAIFEGENIVKEVKLGGLPTTCIGVVDEDKLIVGNEFDVQLISISQGKVINSYEGVSSCFSIEKMGNSFITGCLDGCVELLKIENNKIKLINRETVCEDVGICAIAVIN